VVIYQQQLSRFVAMSAATVRRSVAKEVAKRVKEGTCLVCECKANGSRGLCSGHYIKFYRELQSRPADRRAEFEAEQIRAGRVLAAGQLRQINNPSPFTSEDEQN
jgi:hypothetical protein